MKNYLNFETEVKDLEDQLEKLKDPYNQTGLSEVDTQKISKTQDELDEKLKEIIKYYAGLGISIKNSYALNDFYNSRKPENTIMSLGVDATHSFFKQNKYLDPFKEIIVKNIKNNEVLKKFSKIISNRGLSL